MRRACGSRTAPPGSGARSERRLRYSGAMPRRLGILLDDRFRPSAAGMLGESPMLRMQLGFLRWFDEVVLISRVFPESAQFDAPYLLDTPGVRVAPLPAYPRIESLFLEPWRWWPGIERVLARELPGLDAL